MGRSHGFSWTPERRAEVSALRAAGLMYYEISKQLSVKWGQHLTESQCRSAMRAPPAQPQLVSFSGGQAPEADKQETKPTVKVRAETKEPHFDAPVVHTSKSRAESYLVISDLQIPYHHPGALDFCKRVRFEFGVPLENVLCVGDETDSYWASRFEKSAQAPHTAEQEIAETRKELARWAVAFPHMRICFSNHGNRMLKKAARDGFPRSTLKDFREILGTPSTWHWSDHWLIKGSKQEFRMEHGHKGPGGHSGLRTRPLFRGVSTVWGHEITAATIHLDAQGQRVWGMCVGALTTREPVAAFEYAEDVTYRAAGTVGVVLDGGRLPLVVRM